MTKKGFWLVILLFLLLVPIVFAVKDWEYITEGQCSQQTQCLVSNANNELFNNQPDRYWTGLVAADKPKCIGHGQYILDHYCEQGEWSSRTKLVAKELLSNALARGSTNFALYCSDYDAVLNRYQYATQYGSATSFIRKFCKQPGDVETENCVNSVCVMNDAGTISFGMAINTDISGDKSPLQALDLKEQM